jgi:hypothetical protein
MLTIELGEDQKIGRCHCCGTASETGHGFIYKNGTPYGVYYAGWAAGHKERGVTLAIALGEWDEGTTSQQRTCVGLEAYEGKSEILFRFIEPDSSPWPDTELFGRMVSREEAVKHRLRPEVLAVAEMIVREHPAVRQFLNALE